MSFNIAAFTAEVQSGFQKPNRYRVRFPIPPVLNGYQPFTASLPTLEFFAESADLVDIGFATRNIVRYGYGMSEKKPFTPIVNDVAITFYNDSVSSNLGFFQQWTWAIQNYDLSNGIVVNGQQGLNTTVQPYELLYKDDYAVDGMITLIDNNDNDVATWRMRRMWPMHITNTKLGWAIINDIMKITVVFNYTDWYIDTSQSGTLISTYKALSNAGQQSGQTNAVNTYLNDLWTNSFNSGNPPQS